jgi:hypothetical protein
MVGEMCCGGTQVGSNTLTLPCVAMETQGDAGGGEAELATPAARAAAAAAGCDTEPASISIATAGVIQRHGRRPNPGAPHHPARALSVTQRELLASPSESS